MTSSNLASIEKIGGRIRRRIRFMNDYSAPQGFVHCIGAVNAFNLQNLGLIKVPNINTDLNSLERLRLKNNNSSKLSRPPVLIKYY